MSRGRAASALFERRRTFLLTVLAVSGALVCAGQVVQWSLMGAWPFYDTACFWLGGLHLREGAAVYGDLTIQPFRYAPPWAVLWAPLSLLPLQVVTAGLLGLQVLAFRYVCGSWRNAGLVAWLPIVPRELVTGNIDLLLAAALYAPLVEVRRSGWAVTLFALAKFSPAAVLIASSRARWKEAAIAGVVLVALTLPVLHLWPEWAAYLGNPPVPWLPLLPRIPVGLALLAYRRPWSVAAGAAILTPSFYFHSLVLLIPAIRLAGPGRLTQRLYRLAVGSRIAAPVAT